MPMVDSALEVVNATNPERGQTSSDEGTEAKEIMEQTECRYCINLKTALDTNDDDHKAFLKTTRRLADEIREWERKYATLEKRYTEMKESMEQTVLNLKTVLDTKDDEHKALLKTTRKLADEIRERERKYSSLEKRSNDITAQMAGVLELSGNLENVNDQFANSKLSKRFQDLYDRQWTELSEWLQENVENMSEIQQIKFITSLMKIANKECIDTAENQVRQFLLLDKHEPLPSPQEDPELFKIRRANGQKDTTRRKLTQKLLDDILSSKDAISFVETNKWNEIKGKLEDFFTEFVDICWLMTISHPKMVLNFDVIGESYSGTIKERFKQYSCQDTITDKTQPDGTIFEVVWPSVELENGEGVWAKGDVITLGTVKADQDGCENSELQ